MKQEIPQLKHTVVSKGGYKVKLNEQISRWRYTFSGLHFFILITFIYTYTYLLGMYMYLQHAHIQECIWDLH